MAIWYICAVQKLFYTIGSDRLHKTVLLSKRHYLFFIYDEGISFFPLLLLLLYAFQDLDKELDGSVYFLIQLHSTPLCTATTTTLSLSPSFVRACVWYPSHEKILD